MIARSGGRAPRRARFVGALLEEFDFQVQVREDGLSARLEGYEEEAMKEKLRILGYLLIHTRQIDMVMYNEACCVRLERKLTSDISTVILAKPSCVTLHNSLD